MPINPSREMDTDCKGRFGLSKDGWVSVRPMMDHPLWIKKRQLRGLTSFELELTARCNLNCSHCYINLPIGDLDAKKREISLTDIEQIADEAVSLGAVGCLLTGGEPLLRDDFEAIYLALKQKGLLITLFTNATLITDQHIELFQKFPPHGIEVTVYGVTEKTYNRITRKRGAFTAFLQGLDSLIAHGIGVRLKAVALRSNLSEMAEIARFCRKRTKDTFRFDPLIHLRYDRNPDRNREIQKERLSPKEIADIERADTQRFHVLCEGCHQLIAQPAVGEAKNRLFLCGAGSDNVCVSPDGLLRPCATLWEPSCLYDLESGSLRDAVHRFMPGLKEIRTNRSDFLERCGECRLINLCQWCPAMAFLETGRMDSPVDYFCEVANFRAAQIQGCTDVKNAG